MLGDTRTSAPRGATSTLRARLARLDLYDWASALLLFALLVLVAFTFDAYAISNDEGVQHRYGELIVRYYASGFADQSLFHFDNLYLYGGLFDVIAVLGAKLLPFADPYAIRHVLCTLCGIAGVGGVLATARMIGGPRAGLLAALTLAVTGSWYGSMFNHTKDIPFAAAMIWAVYFLCRMARDLPVPRRRHVLMFGLTLGCALGIRVLGLLLVGYAALAILACAMVNRRRAMREQLAFFAQSTFALAPAFLLAYVIMVAAWPWAAQAPLNPLRGLIDFSEFNYQIKTLFNGHIYMMGEVPRWYIPVYLLIKLPLLMLAGAAAAAALMTWRGRPAFDHTRMRLETALVAVVAIFPVLCEVIDRGPAFTGLRHFLFVVPAFAVLAGLGFHWLLLRVELRGRGIRVATAAAIVAALAWNASVLVRLHPYQYLYFNPLVGGLEGAAGRYIMDYWVNIMPEAVDGLEAYVAKLDRDGRHHPQRYKVAVCGERIPFEKAANSRLAWTEDWQAAEFFIAPTHMNCDRVLEGSLVTTIDRIGVRIGVVKDRRKIVAPAIASTP